MTNHIAVLEDIRKEYAAYDNAHHQLVALDAAIALMRGRSEESEADDWPFVEEIGRDGKPTGYWVRKGSPAAARMSAPAGSGEVHRAMNTYETISWLAGRKTPEQLGEEARKELATIDQGKIKELVDELEYFIAHAGSEERMCNGRGRVVDAGNFDDLVKAFNGAAAALLRKLQQGAE